MREVHNLIVRYISGTTIKVSLYVIEKNGYNKTVHTNKTTKKKAIE